MKFIPFLFILASCTPRTECHYELSTYWAVPDSLADDLTRCVQETMRGASSGLTTSDYEDMDDAILAAHAACKTSLTLSHPTLTVFCTNEHRGKQLDPRLLTRSERDTLLALMNK